MTSSAASTASTKPIALPKPTAAKPAGSFTIAETGTFEDVTATSGIFDSSSKSLGVAMLDYDHDGWPDLLVANDTQPNKLYRNQRNGTFKDVAVEAGIAFSAEGKARAGMGVDVADFDNSGVPGVAITNFDNEMIGLYRASKDGSYADVAAQSGVGLASKDKLGFGCIFLDADLDGSLDLAVVNGHIDDTVRNVRNVGYAQPPQLFLNDGQGMFREVAAEAGGGFSTPKVGRGLAYADFDRDGDLDLLMTTNNGPAYLYRNDQLAGNQQHPHSPGRHQIESRWHRRRRQALKRRTHAIPPGQGRLQLPLAIRVARYFWFRKARPRGPHRDRMAQRQIGRVQEPRSRASL